MRIQPMVLTVAACVALGACNRPQTAALEHAEKVSLTMPFQTVDPNHGLTIDLAVAAIQQKYASRCGLTDGNFSPDILDFKDAAATAVLDWVRDTLSNEPAVTKLSADRTHWGARETYQYTQDGVTMPLDIEATNFVDGTYRSVMIRGCLNLMSVSIRDRTVTDQLGKQATVTYIPSAVPTNVFLSLLGATNHLPFTYRPSGMSGQGDHARHTATFRRLDVDGWVLDGLNG